MIEPRFRALVLLTTFANLRWGEAVALRRKDLDLDARTVRVERTLIEVAGKPQHFGPPKTEAGTRTLPIPSVILDDLRSHLDRFAEKGDAGLVFVGERGAMLRGRVPAHLAQSVEACRAERHTVSSVKASL